MAITETTTTQFEVMGDSGIPKSVCNLSGQRSRYTMQGKGVGSVTSDADPAIGTKANRRGREIKDANGPSCKIQAKISFPNSPEASNTGRNVKTVPSAIGNRDFWQKRSEGGKI